MTIETRSCLLVTLIIAHSHETDMTVSPMFYGHSFNKQYLNACPMSGTVLGTKRHTLISTYLYTLCNNRKLSSRPCLFKSSLSLKKNPQGCWWLHWTSFSMQGLSTIFVNGHLTTFSHPSSGHGTPWRTSFLHEAASATAKWLSIRKAGLVLFVLCSGASVKG